MKNKLKLDITGLIGAVVLICICIAAIVITLISGLGAGLTLAIVVPYVIIMVFSLFFVWKFIEAIYLESEEEISFICEDMEMELLKKDDEIKQLKEKLSKKNDVLHKKSKR